MRRWFHRLLGLARCGVLVGLGAGVLIVAFAGPRCQGHDCWLWFLSALRPRKDFTVLGAVGILLLEAVYRLTRPPKRRAAGNGDSVTDVTEGT